MKLMGIVNVTPDSFYDGGRYVDTRKAIDHAHHLMDEGGEIIDIGGESTRPGATPVSLEEELARVLPVVSELSNVPFSIDTYKPEVARACLDLGACMINDVYGLHEEMYDLAREYDAALVVMHKGSCSGMVEFFQEKLDLANRKGVEKIVLDPGFGFGKNSAESAYLLDHLSELCFGYPLLVGVSGKKSCGSDVFRSAMIAKEQGVAYFRVHDVKRVSEFLTSSSIFR